ncbi:MAG: hypothetical protein VYB65_05840 [Myxococcota bacterium]|nr:hypothetical protein [Myxococcota bacterium]
MSWRRITALRAQLYRLALHRKRLWGVLALPVLLACAVRLALPVVEGAKPTVVAAGSFQQRVVDQLEARAQVAWVRDRDAVVERVGGVDDVIGVFGAPNQAVEVILEGNEPRALRNYPGLVLNEVVAELEGGTPLVVAQQRVPLRSMQRRHRLMALMLVLMVLIVAAAVGLSMVDDREGGQLDALRSSPLSVGEYLLAHGLMGCELSLVVVLSCAGILTGGHVPWWLIPAAWVALVPSAALLTLCLCVVARSQMTAMWVLRVAFPLALLPVLVGVLFGGSGQFWLQPLTMFWGGQAMFAALEGRPDQVVDALVWSVATGAPVLALLAYGVKRRLVWVSPSAGAERRTVPR